MIEINDVSKVFKISKKEKKQKNTIQNEVFAVKNVSLKCSPGRVFSILGANGAGKTTLLRMVATMISPTMGDIKVSGFDTIKQSIEVRRKIGFLTGTTGLYDSLTADELLDYLKIIYKINDLDFKTQKEYLYNLLGIGEFSNKRIANFSVGMKQKVSIARTLIHNPEVIIFDEPTTGLDVITAKNIIKLIRDSSSQGKTVVFSSHIMSEVDLLCDDLAIIHKGQIIYNDTMDSFREGMTKNNLTEEFIERVENSKF